MCCLISFCCKQQTTPPPQIEGFTPTETKVAAIGEEILSPDIQQWRSGIIPPTPERLSSIPENPLQRKRQRSPLPESPTPLEEETTPLLCGNPGRNSSFLLGLSESRDTPPLPILTERERTEASNLFAMEE